MAPGSCFIAHAFLLLIRVHPRSSAARIRHLIPDTGHPPCGCGIYSLSLTIVRFKGR